MHVYYCTYTRWLKASGVVLAGEKAQREISKELLGADLVAEPAPLSFHLATIRGRGVESFSTSVCPRSNWEIGPAPRTEYGEVTVTLNAFTKALENIHFQW